MMRKLTFLWLAFCFVGCALQPVSEPRRPDADNEPTPVPTAAVVEKPTYIVERGSVVSEFVVAGRVTPIQESRLIAPRAGQVAELFVARDEMVTAGDALLRLDTSALEQELAAAEAALTLAETQFSNATDAAETAVRRVEIRRDQIQLRLDYAIAQAGESLTLEESLAIDLLQLDLELAELDLAELEASVDPLLEVQVSEAQLRVDELQAEIEAAVLTTPTAGQVLTLNVEAGDLVSLEDVVVVIADLSALEVAFQPSRCDMGDLAEGMGAAGSVSNRTDEPLPMTVRQLPYPYGSGNQGDDECTVRVAFDNAADGNALEVGTRVSMVVEIERRDDVLWLPPAAVRDFNGRMFIVVQDENAQQRVDVVVGLENRQQIEIESGVEEGMVVVGP